MKILLHITLSFIFILSMGNYGCISGPNYPIEPVLTYAGVSDNVILQSSTGQDTIEIYIDFTDGDGDIGQNNGNSRIYLIDSRLGMIQDSFSTPNIPEQGTKNGVDGRITLLYLSTCCLFPDGTPPCSVNEDFPTDSLRLSIYMVDEAGHESNIVETEDIILLCE